MILSKNFSLNEFTKSQTALRLGIDNIPNEKQIIALTSLCDNVIQPVRDHFGITTINSGFRGQILNRRIGGSNRSQHCHGEAGDLEVPGITNYELAAWIRDNLDFDQLILEYYIPGIPDSGWVHVSYRNAEVNRNKCLTAAREHRRTVYKLGLIK